MMNEAVSKFYEISVTKYLTIIKTFKETGHLNYIYKNELEKSLF